MSKKKVKHKPPVQKVIAKPSASYRWLPWLVFLFAFAVYANTISFDFAMDDGMFITYNRLIQNGISSFPDLISKGILYGFNDSNTAGYRPVTLVNLALEYSVFGNNPKWFHFVNVLLYALLCLALFNFLKRILKGYPIYIPALITGLFIVHPLHTEVVANIKSKDEILCMLFGILSVNFLYRYEVEEKGKKIFFVIMSTLCFSLSVFSKENGYSYFGLIPLVLYFFSDIKLKRIAILMLPFFAVTVITLWIRTLVLDSQFATGAISAYDNTLLAAANFSERSATNFVILLHALVLLFFPVNLSWDYSFNHFPVVNWSSPLAIISLIIHLALIACAIIGFKKKNIFSFAILFYFISYFITSNLVINLGSTFGERFLFAPSLAFCIAFPFLVARLFKLDMKTATGQKLVYLNGTVAFAAVLFLVRTVNRTSVWQNDSTLLTSGLETAPNSARAHSAYAKIYLKAAEAMTDKNQKERTAAVAMEELKKAEAIYARDFDMYFNKGVLYHITGDTVSALKEYRKALELNPAYPGALNNIGSIYSDNRNYTTALDYFLQIIKKKPRDSKAWGNAGACYQNMQDTKTALNYYAKALEYDPANKEVLGNLSALYTQMGDSTKGMMYRSMFLEAQNK